MVEGPPREDDDVHLDCDCALPLTVIEELANQRTGDVFSTGQLKSCSDVVLNLGFS